MNKIMTFLVAALISFSAMAEHHNPVQAEVRDAVNAFNGAYADGDVKAYFNYYADEPTLYFYGSRQDVSAYHEEWTQLVAGGYSIEKYDLSDVQVQVMSGGNAAVATYFIDFRSRDADGGVSDARAFETDVWQKIDGEWKVISLHYTEIPPDD